jgi:DNA-binding CsgD family transcriptional regulator
MGPVTRHWKTYIAPECDPHGNMVRMMILALLGVIVCMFLLFTDPADRHAQYYNLVNILLAAIPLSGAIYSYYRIDKYRKYHDEPPRTSPVLAHWFRYWCSFLNGNLHATMLAWFTLGIFAWASGIIYSTLIQNLVTHDLINTPPISAGCELFYVLLPIGWLLGTRSLYHARHCSFGSALREHASLTVPIVATNVVLSAGLAAIAVNGQFDTIEHLLVLATGLMYGLLDGLILAAVVLRPQVLDTDMSPSPLRYGLKIAGIAWWMMTFTDQAAGLTMNLPLDATLHAHVGSFLDVMFILSVSAMIHGLLFTIYAITVGHPHVSFLSERHRALARFLIQGASVKEIARAENTNPANVERHKTELYRVTGFDDRTSKLLDFVAHYRDQLKMFDETEGIQLKQVPLARAACRSCPKSTFLAR